MEANYESWSGSMLFAIYATLKHKQKRGPCGQGLRGVEIPYMTCPAWSHFIQDKLKISIYLSWNKYKES